MTRHSSRPRSTAGYHRPGAASQRSGPKAARIQSLLDFQRLFESLPSIHVVITADPDYIMVAASRAFMRVTMTRQDDIIGQGLFTVFADKLGNPDASGTRQLRASLNRVVATAAPDHMPVQRYDLRRPDGSFEVHWWQPLNTPICGPDGKITHVLHTVEDVTASIVERQRAAEALARSEARARDVLERMGEGFIYLDQDFRILEINAKGLRIDVRSREAILERHLLEVWPEAERLPTWPAYQRAMSERMSIALEYRHLSDMHDVWLDVRVYPVADGGLAVFYRNITGRKRDEERLRASERRLKVTQDNAGIGLHEVDDKGRYLSINETFTRLTGYTMAHLAGRSFLELIEGEADRRQARETFERLVRGESEIYSERHLSTDTRGRCWWAEMRTTAVRDDHGRFLYGVRVVEDITERLAAEEALRASEARFRLLADAIPQIVWLADADGNIDFLNRQWAAYTSAPPEAATNPNGGWLSLVHPDDRAPTLHAWNEAQRARTTFEVEYRIRLASGEWRWFLGLAQPHCDPATVRVLRWFGTSTDIHDRKQADARLRELVGTLDLAAIMVRDLDGTIRFWSQGCERLYGWTAGEAVGQVSHTLLRTEFPVPVAEIEAALLCTGEWQGVLSRMWWK